MYKTEELFTQIMKQDKIVRMRDKDNRLKIPNIKDQNYVAQEPPVSNGQVISQDKRLASYCLCSPYACLCYSSCGLVSDSDIIGRDIIEIILFSKWSNQCIYVLDEESEEYGDTNNDGENYECDNKENRQNKTIPIDDRSNDTKDVHPNYNSKQETQNLKSVRYDAKIRSPSDNFVPLNVQHKIKLKYGIYYFTCQCFLNFKKRDYFTLKWRGCYQTTVNSDCARLLGGKK